jgi:hypothetical protein
MILDGVEITSIEHLESLIANMSDNTKTYLRNEYAGAPSGTPSTIKPVTPRQIRLALNAMGVPLVNIENAINALPEPTRTQAWVTWDYSTEFQRNNPLVAALAPALGFTPEQLDQLWQLASNI